MPSKKEGKWVFVQMGTKKQLEKLQKGIIGYKSRIEPFTVMIIDDIRFPAREKKTYKLEKWIS
jgi:hypothetical protein